MARLTMEIPDSLREDLDRLKNKTEAASITEVVRRAIRFYEVVCYGAGDRGCIDVLVGDDKLTLIVR